MGRLKRADMRNLVSALRVWVKKLAAQNMCFWVGGPSSARNLRGAPESDSK